MGWILFYAIGLIVIIILLVGQESWQPHWAIATVVIAGLFIKSIYEYMNKRRTHGEAGRPKTEAGRAASASRAAKLLNLSPQQEKAFVYIYEHDNITIDEFAQLCPGTDRTSLEQDLQKMIQLGLMKFKDGKYIIT